MWLIRGEKRKNFWGTGARVDGLFYRCHGECAEFGHDAGKATMGRIFTGDQLQGRTGDPFTGLRVKLVDAQVVLVPQASFPGEQFEINVHDPGDLLDLAFTTGGEFYFNEWLGEAQSAHPGAFGLDSGERELAAIGGAGKKYAAATEEDVLPGLGGDLLGDGFPSQPGGKDGIPAKAGCAYDDGKGQKE